MGSRRLRSCMVLYGDTLDDLAAALGINRGTVSRKICGTRNQEFRQSEIKVIIARYSLTPEEVCAIFFSDETTT